jgi:hypothetical protein
MDKEVDEMRLVKGFFDGMVIKLKEPVLTQEKTEVLILFPDNMNKIEPQKARKLLRGSGKGEKLNEILLKERREELLLER